MVKEITIDDLARMVAKGFESTASDIADIKGDVAGLKGDIADLREDVTSLNGRVGRIEQTVTDIRETLDREQAFTSDAYENHATRLERIETHLDLPPLSAAAE